MGWIILALVVSFALNLATIVLVLALLGGKDDRFVTWRQLHQLLERQDRLAKSQSDLFRYLEGLDEQTGGAGHRLLVQGLSVNDASTGK